MPNFQWKNLTSYGPANASATANSTNFTSTATSEAFDNSIYSSNAPDSLVWTGTVAVGASTAAVSASGSQVTSAGGDLLFTNSVNNVFTFGRIVQFTTSTSLPTGISTSTNYYVVPITNATYKVATSLANAIAGTYIAYTDTGTGNQTATPVAYTTGSMILQGSNDNGTTWSTVPNSTQTLTGSGSWVFELDYIRYGAYRTLFTNGGAGQVSFSVNQIGYRGA